MKSPLIPFFILCLIFLISSCQNNSSTTDNLQTILPAKSSEENRREANKSSAPTYHTDQDYKYEYRTGETGDYNYNYDVSGTDEEGNSVSGNIDMNGKYGEGTIEDDYGNEIEVDLEWIGYGELEATDENGNTYELEVD